MLRPFPWRRITREQRRRFQLALERIQSVGETIQVPLTAGCLGISSGGASRAAHALRTAGITGKIYGFGSLLARYRG